MKTINDLKAEALERRNAERERKAHEESEREQLRIHEWQRLLDTVFSAYPCLRGHVADVLPVYSGYDDPLAGTGNGLYLKIDIPNHASIGMVWVKSGEKSGQCQWRQQVKRFNGLDQLWFWVMCEFRDDGESNSPVASNQRNFGDFGDALLFAEEQHVEYLAVAAKMDARFKRDLSSIVKVKGQSIGDRLLEALRQYICAEAPSGE